MLLIFVSCTRQVDVYSLTYSNPYPDIMNTIVLKGNLHGHTSNSDSQISPKEYMEKYRDANYDFAAITDHDNYENAQFVPEYASYPTMDPNVEGIIFMGPSYEDSSPSQHINIFKVSDFLGFKGRRSINQVLNKASKKGLICSLNHPNWHSQYLSDETILGIKEPLLFVEVWNGTMSSDVNDNEEAENAWSNSCRAWDLLLSSGHIVYAIATDDFHIIPPYPDNHFFRKGYVEVYSKGRTAEDIWTALEYGQFVACNGLSRDNSINITTISCKNLMYHVEVENPCDIFFIGENGIVLQEDLATTSATYYVKGTEKYVRCSVKNEKEYKWLQPMIRK